MVVVMNRMPVRARSVPPGILIACVFAQPRGVRGAGLLSRSSGAMGDRQTRRPGATGCPEREH